MKLNLSYTATVTASDGTNSTTQDITVNVTNQNDNSPIFTSEATFSAAENQTAIGTVVATDADGDSITYSISGSDITINSSSGVIAFASAPDYETTTSYSATVTASDGTNSTTQDITVNVTNENDAPKISNSNVFSIDENQRDVGQIIASDDDEDSLTYSISGSDFTISDSGVISFTFDPDYETQNIFQETVTVSDSVNASTQVITVNVNNLNDNSPQITSRAEYIVEKGATNIGSVTATDLDGITSFIYSISDSDLEVSDQGVITLSEDINSSKRFITAILSVSDSINTATQTIYVAVGDTVSQVGETIDFHWFKNRYWEWSNSSTFFKKNNRVVSTNKSYDFDGTNWIDNKWPNNNEDTPDQDTPAISVIDTNEDGTYQLVGLITENYISYENFSINRLINNEWVNVGSLNGIADSYLVDSKYMTISDDGLRFAAHEIEDSTESFDASKGYCAIYEYASGSWSQIGRIQSSFYGTCKLSGNGNAIATVSNTSRDIKVYKYTNSSWVQQGLSMSAEDNSTKILINKTGSIIAFNNTSYYGSGSSYCNNNNTGDASLDGKVSVYEYKDDAWSIKGNEISGPFGICWVGIADINEDGDKVLISGYGDYEGILDPDGEQMKIHKTFIMQLHNSKWWPITKPINNLLNYGAYVENGQIKAGPVSTQWQTRRALSSFSPSSDSSFGSVYFDKYGYSFNETTGWNCQDHRFDCFTTDNLSIYSVNTTNSPPEASNKAFSLNLLPQAQTTSNFSLSGVATDIDGDSLTYSVVTNGIYGTATINGNTLAYQTDASTKSSATETITIKANDGNIDSESSTITIYLKTDPLYQYQWHLNNTGQTNFASNGGTSGADLNLDSVIVSGYTGDGVVVSIIDDGLEIAHEDLVDNVVTGSWNFNNSSSDPTLSSPCEEQTNSSCGGHGTSVAGIIAAKGWNNKGGRGIAPDASIIGYNLLGRGGYYYDEQNQARGVNPPGGVTADIYNMSYGPDYGEDENGDPKVTYELPEYIEANYQTVVDGFVNGVNNLRSGKGAIYLKASGNEFSKNSTSDCGTTLLACNEIIWDAETALPYLMNISALDANDISASYSTPGAGLWVSGYGGEYGSSNPAIMTTDRSSCDLGYSRSNNSVNDFMSGTNNENSDCNYASTFNGTSSATPAVAGVVALMLDANPDLTWRDVKHILALTAQKIHSSASHEYQGITQFQWIENKAGYNYHNWYGFGKVDTEEAVSAAESFTANNLGSFITTGFVGSGTLNQEISYPDYLLHTIPVSKPAGSNGKIEFVRVSIIFDHEIPKSIGIRLLSPDGTVHNIMQPLTNVGTNPKDYYFDIGVSGFYGENIEGNWSIAIDDYIDDSISGTLIAWGIEIYGN